MNGSTFSENKLSMALLSKLLIYRLKRKEEEDLDQIEKMQYGITILRCITCSVIFFFLDFFLGFMFLFRRDKANFYSSITRVDANFDEINDMFICFFLSGMLPKYIL